MAYEEDISIDESSLDVEWLEQPRLMLKYARTAAIKEMKLSDAKQAVDVKRAELDRGFRQKPEKLGMDKVTDTAVMNAIISHPEYIKVLEEYNEAQYEFNMAKAAVKALEHKKDALEYLVRLHGMQYFAGPTMPRDLTEEYKKRQKDSNEKVKSALKPSRKTNV